MKHSVASYNTKRLLVRSLAEIMREKELSKISVSEVAERAGVNRKTFYYHFKDIQSLLHWIVEDQVKKVTSKYDVISDNRIIIESTIDFLDEYRDFLLNIIRSTGTEHLQQYLSECFGGFVRSTVEYVLEKQGKTYEADYVSFLCEFYTAALAGVFVDYVVVPEHHNRKKLSGYLMNLYGSIARNF